MKAPSQIFLLFLGLLLTLLLSTTEACKCIQPTLNTSIANNEIAVHVKVGRAIDTDDETLRYYVGNKIQTFKGCDVPLKFVIKTTSSSASCGVDLALNTQYLLFGSVSKEVVKGYGNDKKVVVLSINSCQFQRKWSRVSEHNRRKLRRLTPCPKCHSDKDCSADQYCAGGKCRKDGTCRNTRDCFNPSNFYQIAVRCIYYVDCDDDHMCSPVCGSSCPDGLSLAECFAAPCDTTTCKEKYASCHDDYCGGCNALFFNAKGDPVCEGSH